MSPNVPEPLNVNCESCGVPILAITAESYGGCCAPCFNKFNERPAPKYVQPKSSPIRDAIGCLIPFVIVGLVLVGVPYAGYKLILAEQSPSIHSGTIKSVNLIREIPAHQLSGRPARIESDYLIIELESGGTLWIPESNVAGIEFTEK